MLGRGAAGAAVRAAVRLPGEPSGHAVAYPTAPLHGASARLEDPARVPARPVAAARGHVPGRGPGCVRPGSAHPFLRAPHALRD